MSIIKINKNKKHKNTKNYPQYLYIDFRSGLPYILQKKIKKIIPTDGPFLFFVVVFHIHILLHPHNCIQMSKQPVKNKDFYVYL
jgi:hypothetical protein